MMRPKETLVTCQLALTVIPRGTRRTSRTRTILKTSKRTSRRTSRRMTSPRTSSSRTGTNRTGMVKVQFLPFPRSTEASYIISENASSPIFRRRWKSKVDCCLPTAEINVFCFLSSLPLLLPATTAVFGSSLSSVYSKLTLVRRCGLAYQYDWRGFVGPKKCGPLSIIQSSLAELFNKFFLCLPVM